MMFEGLIEALKVNKAKESKLLDNEIKKLTEAIDDMLSYVNKNESDILNCLNQRITFNPLRAIMAKTVVKLQEKGDYENANFYLQEIAKSDIGFSKFYWSHNCKSIKIEPQGKYLN